MEKFFLKSKTILGVILAALPTILPIVGVSWGANDGQLVSDGWDAAIQLAGAITAIIGRFKASDKISFLPKNAAL